MRHLLNGEMMEPMDPWYKGFKGTIERTDPTKQEVVGYTVKGIIEEINETTLRITDLPIRRWTRDYRFAHQEMDSGLQGISRVHYDRE